MTRPAAAAMTPRATAGTVWTARGPAAVRRSVSGATTPPRQSAPENHDERTDWPATGTALRSRPRPRRRARWPLQHSGGASGELLTRRPGGRVLRRFLPPGPKYPSPWCPPFNLRLRADELAL